MDYVSIIICTYNRDAILLECIESILNNNTDKKEYEILVVDNNSKDNTEDIVRGLCKGHSNIRYVKENKVGLSYARNRGIAEAKGTVLAFIDDDVTLTPNYINFIVTFFKEHPEEVCVAGKVIPVWKMERPEWFVNDFASIIGETTYGEEKRILNYLEDPIGCNMIFKRNIFENIGLFNINLGIKGDELFLGEENELCERIRKMNKDIYYLPNVTVYHNVHINKVNKDYILKRLWLEGNTIAQWDYETKSIFERFLRFLIRIMVLFIRDYPNYYLSKLFCNQYFSKECKVTRTKSYIVRSIHFAINNEELKAL